MDAKLKCVFELPDADDAGEATAAVKVAKTETSSLPPLIVNEEKVSSENFYCNIFLSSA